MKTWKPLLTLLAKWIIRMMSWIKRVPCAIESAEESVLWPGEMTVVGTNFGDHFLITLDTPMCTNIISVNEALRLILLAL